MDKHKNSAKGFNLRSIQIKTTWGIVLVGLFSLGISVIALLLSLDLFPFTSSLPHTIGAGPTAKPIDWNILGDVTSLVTMCLFLGGVVFAFIEYIQNVVERRRQIAETSFNIYREVYDRLMSPEALRARRWIILNITVHDKGTVDRNAWLLQVNAKLDEIPPDWKGERPPGREYLKHTLNTLDFIGFVSKHYWNMENELVEWMNPPIAKVWDRIGSYVKEEATRRNEPDYYESACEFAEYCVKLRQGRYPQSRIIENAT